MGFCCYIYRDTFLVIEGPCTTVIDIELGDRFTSVSFKWLFMLRLNRGGGGSSDQFSSGVCCRVFEIRHCFTA